jgi:hypothetical protein
MKNNYLLILCFLIFTFFPVYANEELELLPEETENLNDSVYVINSFVFNIDGITRPSALIYNAELKIGEEITGRSNLEKYIREKRQLLYNQRLFDRITIEYSIQEMQADGKYPVNLIISVKDTWNIIAIPRPQYSSSTGFDMTIKARDYNFLGTMSPLRLDFGFQRDISGQNFYTVMLDSDIPFNLFDLNWNFDFDHDYTYRPDMELPHYYKNTTGLSVELPFNRTIFTVGFSESLIINDETPRKYRLAGYPRFQEGLYMSSTPYISWKIPTGLHYYDLGEIHYTPSLSTTFTHEFSNWPLEDFRKGPFVTYSHRLDFGRIDWNDNFQKGAQFIISNSNRFNFYYFRNDMQPWSSNVNIRAIGHKIINDYLGFSCRLMYRHWFFDDYSVEAGDVLRGVLNNNVTTNYMFSLNLDFPIRVLNFRSSEWSSDSNVLRIFDFDLHLSPIIDAALYNDPVNQRVFGLENLLLTSGMEVIVFPSRWRSLFLRISYGRNFSLGTRKNSSELFIGTDLHY